MLKVVSEALKIGLVYWWTFAREYFAAMATQRAGPAQPHLPREE
jgi:hypothetical protein